MHPLNHRAVITPEAETPSGRRLLAKLQDLPSADPAGGGFLHGRPGWCPTLLRQQTIQHLERYSWGDWVIRDLDRYVISAMHGWALRIA